MIYDGLLDEVKMLASRNLPVGTSARQALGYKELFDYLEGKSTYPQAVEYIKQNSRNFAKRQETWFRGLCECRFIPADKPVFDGVDDLRLVDSSPASGVARNFPDEDDES